MPNPDERTWHCRLCSDVITGRAYAALMDHVRLMHPDVECDVRRPDGQVRLADATGKGCAMRVQINAGGRQVDIDCPDSGNSIREITDVALAAWKATDGAQPPSDGPASYGFASERRANGVSPMSLGGYGREYITEPKAEVRE